MSQYIKEEDGTWTKVGGMEKPLEEYVEEVEERVGTYCDGKPIYKLTIRGYSGNGGVSLFKYNIKYPLKIEGFAKKYGSDASFTPLPTFGGNGEIAALAFNVSGSGAEVAYRVKGFSYRHSDIDFTVWYTKTTD